MVACSGKIIVKQNRERMKDMAEIFKRQSVPILDYSDFEIGVFSILKTKLSGLQPNSKNLSTNQK